MAMANHMDLRSGFTGRTADLLRLARSRAAEIDQADADHPD
jgi:hypothetical protein